MSDYRKTIQTIEIEVRGPDGLGRYCVSHPGARYGAWSNQKDFVGAYKKAIVQHIASAPQFVEIGGFLIAPHHSLGPGGFGVWEKDDRASAEQGEGGLVAAKDEAQAIERANEYIARGVWDWARAHLALAEFFATRKDSA